MPPQHRDSPLTGVRVVRWAESGQPSEQTLRERLLAEGLEPYRWSNGAHATYGEHRHSYEKILYVVEGSISFSLPEQGRTYELAAGDRLELPAYANHTALVGPQGVVCLEAPRS